MLAESGDKASITVYSDYLQDPAGELSLDDVRQPEVEERFQPAAHALQRLGFSDHPWWLRVALRNETGAPRTRNLVVSTGPVSQLRLYAPTEDGYQARAPQPMAYDRFLPHDRHHFRVELPPDTTRIYYLRVLPDHGFHYSLELTSDMGALDATLFQASSFWLAAGLVTGLALFHLILFGLIRTPVYCAYALFFGLVTLIVMTYAGFWVPPEWPADAGQAQWSAFLILMGLAANTWLGFTYLRVPLQLPRFDRPLRILMIMLTAGALVALWVPVVPALALSYGTAAVVALALFWLGIYGWQRSTPGAGLYVLGRAGITLTTLLVVAALQQWYALQWNFPLLLLAAGGLEAMVLAFGLQRARETRLHEKLHERQQQQLDNRLREVRQDTLARVSHEVRTPMSGIMGMAEILEETPLTPNQREYVRAIQTAGNDLLRVVGDVLMFSGDAVEPPQSRPEAFALTPCVMDALDLFRERAEERDIELIPHIHANVPDRVHGDADRLRQVLVNLLACAARHGQPGELIIDVARDPTGRGGFLRFEFSGSALRDTDAVWSALDGDPDMSATDDSTALGLSTARQLVMSMHGEMQWHHDRQRRPLCRFSLPLADAGTETEAEHSDVALNGYHLLIIDDSPTVARVIRQQALSWGMRVTVTHDPREALATIRTHAHIRDPFDVVVLDQQMPGMDGLQLATRIREDEAGQSLTLIMLSGIQSPPSSGAIHDTGLHEVLTKPVSGARLRRSLAGALGLVTETPAPVPEPAAEPEPELRLLVAEDDPLSQQVMQGMLNRLGMTAEVVSNGREAVDAVRAQAYDLILMDCEMPEMDGFEAARAIRTLEARDNRDPVPIIALTAHILREHRERSQAADMDAHVPKPVELAVLREVISRFAGSAARRPGTSRASDERPG